MTTASAYARRIAGIGRPSIRDDHTRSQESPGSRALRKVESAVKIAKAFLAVQAEFGSFARYQWAFAGGRPVQNRRRSIAEVPARTEISDAFSKDLKKRGFSFVGSTIVHAHMQAVGLVNDHVVDCHRYAALRHKR